jgi:rhodanese-related sulfurtransferase
MGRKENTGRCEMKKLFKKMNLNKKLALAAAAVGVIGLFAGSPYRGSHVNFNTQELSIVVENTTDHVNAGELADWIIKGKTDYRIIDLRTEKEYNEYHIPNAENISITELETANINRNEKVVIYSEGGIHSAQAWMLMKAKGYKGVYILFGGLEEWKDKILFPNLPGDAANEQKAEFEKVKEISKFFGGSPTIGGTPDVKKEMPEMEMPKMQSPGGNPQQPGQKKKKEGC